MTVRNQNQSVFDVSCYSLHFSTDIERCTQWSALFVWLRSPIITPLIRQQGLVCRFNHSLDHTANKSIIYQSNVSCTV